MASTPPTCQHERTGRGEVGPAPIPLALNLGDQSRYPVVAPAVVVGDVEEQSVATVGIHPSVTLEGSTSHHDLNYPVATVVAGFDESTEATNLNVQAPPTTLHAQESIFPLSIHSDTEVSRTGIPPVAASAIAQQHHHAVSGPTVGDMRNGEAQIIMVDGDPIPILPSQSTELSDGNSQWSQSKEKSRFRRVASKVGKMIGRNKKKGPQAMHRGSSFGSTSVTSIDLPAIQQHVVLPPAAMVLPGSSTQGIHSSMGRESSVGENSSLQSSGNERQGRTPLRMPWAQRGSSREVSRQRNDSYDAGRQRFDSRDGRDIYLNDEGHGASMGIFSSDHITQLQALPAVPPPTMPGMAPIHEVSSGRLESATATPLGTEIEVLQQQPNNLPPATSAEAFIEYEFYDDEDEKARKEEIPASLVPPDADLKVQKADAPDVESMLLRAAHETITDIDQQEIDYPVPKRKGKSDGSSVPLSQAKRSDTLVHNDMLKIVMVGSVGHEKSALSRAIRETPKRNKKRTTIGLDVHNWSVAGMNFHLWDVQGATTSPGWSSDNVPNFGAHPSTQSLFFSDESLYLLVWDLACHNPHVNPVFDYDSDEEDEFVNEYAKEQAVAEADRALQEDIATRVLGWVDRIAQRAPGSAVLPVALIPDGMESSEIKRRCSKMFEMLESHIKWNDGKSAMPNIVLDDSKNVLCVNFTQSMGIKQIQETIVAIAESGSVFGNLDATVPPGTVEVLEYTRRVKRDHKLIRLDHVVGELSDSIPMQQVVKVLRFLSSVGEILYFGTEEEDILSSFVILSRQWLVSALSCILRNDLRRDIADARKFMNMQCIYSHAQFKENEVTKVLTNGAASSCPLLSDDDAKMLWNEMSFMREAADQYSQLNESGTTGPTMFHFLEHLLVSFGVLLPFGQSEVQNSAGLNKSSEVFLVPSLLSQNVPSDIWGFRSTESWTTTLCHSWLFRDGAPSDLFENIAVSLLRDLYDFSQKSSPVESTEPSSVGHKAPIGSDAAQEFSKPSCTQSIGPVRIQHVICWRSSILLKIGTIFPDQKSGEMRESFVEIFITIVDQNSTHCVASDAMRGSMQRVIVSGKGQSGWNGLKLFKGGYQAVLDSVQSSLSSLNNVNRQIVCPDCLARGNPRRASTWAWDEVAAAAEERRESTIVCRRGHRVSSNLLCGICNIESQVVPPDFPPTKPAQELLPSVVLIGLWDPKERRVRSVGSGFVADKKFGLVVTAGHVVVNMEERSCHFGAPYLGIPDAKLFIGVLPQESENKNAVWRYCAEILADDVGSNVDACVLRIRTKLKSDVDSEQPGCDTPEELLDMGLMRGERLAKLKLETVFELEQWVRIIGYSQGDGKEARQRVIRSPDLARGYVVRMFSANFSDGSSSSSDSESRRTFSPREEIVVRCPTIVGHSGGPCVNDEGTVVGILSRADPTDPHRCYLVPAAQLRQLLKRAKKLCSQPFYTTTMRNTM